MKRLGWILAAAFALGAIFFAVLNREAVTLDLWPIPIEIAAPLYLFTFGVLLFGFLLGLFAFWMASAPARRELRRLRRELAERARQGPPSAPVDSRPPIP